MQLVDFEIAEKFLSEYKILSPRTAFVLSDKEALKTIKSFGFPVFLKIYGKNILHRTEKTGVEEVNNKAELLKVFSRMKNIKGVEGVLIQEKIIGKSLILGMKRDPQFGPVIIAGIGGIFAEVIKDFVLRVAPVSEKEAIKMIAELKGYAYLCGKRDKKPINLKAVAKIIVALSQFSLKEKDIKEVDLNPVIADEKRALAVDFKFLK
jgi:acyl-CoA synthetase (NDP forming)